MTALRHPSGHHLDRSPGGDALTGLADRGLLDAHLGVLEACHGRHGEDAAAVVVDVDRFALVNAGWGRGAGDAVLVGVAGLLRACCHGDDVVGRWDQDAFLALLPRTDRDQASAFAERVRRRVELTPLAVGLGAVLSVTVSAGCAQGLGGGGAALLARAARALAAAQAAGRNRVASDPGGVPG